MRRVPIFLVTALGILCAVSWAGPTPTPGAQKSYQAAYLPDFGTASANINNQYLRLDLMDPVQNYSGWGPEATGRVTLYRNEGMADVTLPSVQGGRTVKCRKLRIEYGPGPTEYAVFYLAQDKSGDVYALRFQGYVEGIYWDLVLPNSLYSPTYPNLPLYMPKVATAGQDLGEVFTGFTREVASVNCCSMTLVTGWQGGTFSGNIKIVNSSGREYYHPSAAPGTDPGGLIRVAESDGLNGFDRGDPPPTPTPTPTATATATPMIGWSKASSDSSVSGLVLYGDKMAQEMAGLPAATEAATTQILAHFASNSRWYTGVAIANPDDTFIANVSLTAYSNEGTSMGPISRNVPVHGKISELMSTLFSNAPSTGWLLMTSNIPVLAFDLYGDAISGGIGALPSSPPSSSLILPHFVHSARWWTGVAIVNPSASPISVMVKAYDATGGILGMGTFNIAAFSKLWGYAEVLLPQVANHSGWMSLESTGGQIAALLVYGDKNATPNRIAAFAAVPTNNSFSLSDFRSDANSWTGISIVNPSETASAHVILTARAPDGTLIDTYSTDVGALNKTMGFVSDLFSLGIHTEGWIEVSSDRAVAGLEILNKDDAANQIWGLASVESQFPSQTIYLSHYAVTSRWWTLFALANPSASAQANVTLSAFENSGTQTGTANYAIPPQGRIANFVQTLFGL